MNKLLAGFIILSIAIVLSSVSIINTLENTNNMSYDTMLKITCHDEAVKYRDDMNKTLNSQLYPSGIEPYRYLSSSYNKKINTCLGYFEVTRFKSDLKTIYQTEEVQNVLDYNTQPLASWYGDGANGNIDKGNGIEYGGKETKNYSDWTNSLLQLGISTF